LNGSGIRMGAATLNAVGAAALVTAGPP